ncbi:nucleotidyltransferase family protein [Halomonas sp. NO4]|uniref:nucleotidyltransferase domain-containing protein n=1 Tax=Halomonas sp. NO4 TaxID=2484813 RepID=UPI0013D82438|nr:nucleotidyltransferase family protein [Halomonas sp. NO4]
MRESSNAAPPVPLRLLLLLARLELTPPQHDAALALCQRIDDWSALTEQASRAFILPLVYRHLRRLAPACLPAEELTRMRDASLAVVRHNLRLAAIPQRLASQLLEPLGVPYLFFKGPALAARYYADPGLRYSRDIDLLVPGERMVDLLAAALEQGCTPCQPAALEADRESLAFAVHAQGVITLCSPEGIPLEIHQRLDQEPGLYVTREILADAEPLSLGDDVIRVMPTSELFVYLCLHHTRHHWSRLHWLVDLDAIRRHPDFDLDTTRACARRRGLSATLEAALAFQHACAGPEPWHDETLGAHGHALLRDCLTTLQGDYATELALRQRNTTSDFAYPWQTQRSRRLAWRLGRLVRPWRPSYSDYRQRPLPRDWQWLYWFTRPVRGLVKHLPRSPRS